MVIVGVVLYIINAIGVNSVGIAGRRSVGHPGIWTPHGILRGMVGHRQRSWLVVPCAWAVELRRGGPLWRKRGSAIADRGNLAQHVLAIKSRPLCGVAFLVPIAEIKPNEGPLAVTDTTFVDLLGVMVQLVAVKVLCS